MKKLPGSVSSKSSLLKNKEWYHQRFDGCPMFIFAIPDAEMLKEKRKLPGNIPNVRVCFFSDRKADWHLDMDDVQRATNSIIEAAEKDPFFSKRLMQAWKSDEKKFDVFFEKEFRSLNLGALSDKQLFSLWKKYYKFAIKRFSSTGIIDHFSLGTDSIVSEMVKESVLNQSKKPLRDSELVEIFSIASAPIHQSFINQSEIDLLKIAAGKSKESLERYQQRYFWIKNNYYTSQVLTVEYFADEIKVWKKSKKDLSKEINKLENTPKLNKVKKAELLKRFKFPRLLRTLLTASEDFTYWQDSRKKATYINIYMGSQLLEEIGKRKSYSVEELKYTTGIEIENLFKNQLPTRKELQNRRENSVFLATPKGFYVSTGGEVEKVRKQMWESEQKNDVNDFRGLSASLGKVKGRVRILKSVDEIGRIKKGEILVAVMTRPDYIPAMKKAAAIVTNEGGITSHAAIVSRELGIPCVIGTKIATEVLRDGDLVEVNANHGKVTILERAK